MKTYLFSIFLLQDFKHANTNNHHPMIFLLRKKSMFLLVVKRKGLSMHISYLIFNIDYYRIRNIQ